MKITYIAHASLMIETEDACVVTDPWFNGPAYLNQWHVFPRPVDTSFIPRTTHVVLTHGHEDHTHLPTLFLLPREVKIYCPYSWKNGFTESIRKLGFSRISESPSFKKIRLGKDLFVTFVANGLDAFSVYEYKGQVILNLNDALNASHKSFIHLFSKIIKKRWPKIHLLICGLGGAGYFPNTIHSPKKNDREIGMLREQFLAHKFCELVEELEPDYVVPFVPGFALLEKDKQWINEMKFSRNDLPSYYNEHFNGNPDMEFLNMFPGDVIEDNVWIRQSPYHDLAINDNLSHLLQVQYADEIAALNTYPIQHHETVRELADGLDQILPLSSAGIPEELLKQVNFGIRLLDVEGASCIHGYYADGRLHASVSPQQPLGIKMMISTHSWKLKHAIEQEWGGDVFYIGYGADIDILDHTCLKDNLDIITLRLLSRFPRASANMKKEPVRMMRYLMQNPSFAALAIRQKMASGSNPNHLPYNERSHWISKSKCEVCRLCDIPLLSDQLGDQLALA